jgi:hypothetical protein
VLLLCPEEEDEDPADDVDDVDEDPFMAAAPLTDAVSAAIAAAVPRGPKAADIP